MPSQKWSTQPTKAIVVQADKSLIIDSVSGQSQQFSLSNLVLTTAVATQTITSTGTIPTLTVVGPTSPVDFDTFSVADMANTNFHIGLGANASLGIAGIFAGNSGTGFIPLCLHPYGGSYIGIGSNGNASQLNIFPSIANNGYISFFASDSSTGYTMSITNAALATSNTILTIPDPGTGTSKFILSNSPTFQNILSPMEYASYGYYGAISLPSTPSGGSLIYSRTVSGTTSMYTLNSAGVESLVGGAGVASFNTRTGAVTSQTGDYTAAMVTNAADLSSGSLQTFANQISVHFGLNAINGNIMAGTGGGGNSGSVWSYASDGSALIFSAGLTASAYQAIITNTSLAQSTTFLFPDPSTAAAHVLLSDSGTTQLINTGNLQLSAGYVGFSPIATPSTPTSGADIYAKSDGNLYGLTAGGLEVNLTAGSSSYWSPITYSSQPLLQPTGGSQVGVYFVNGSNDSAIFNDASYMRYYYADTEVMGYNAAQWFVYAAQADFFGNINLETAGASLVLDRGTGTEASNAVTVNNQSGTITTSSLSIAAGSSYGIVFTNSTIAANSTLQLQWRLGSNSVATISMVTSSFTSGSATITIHNIGTVTAISGTILIDFLVV